MIYDENVVLNHTYIYQKKNIIADVSLDIYKFDGAPILETRKIIFINIFDIDYNIGLSVYHTCQMCVGC